MMILWVFRLPYSTRQKMISVGRAFMPDIDESWRIVSGINARPTSKIVVYCKAA
ncbi:hypothetical protein [Wielerella bovis]|uniref:hypothetical protein n=1 Tax=Wielerella bovis TaxID=2917790 RepID=UPI002019BB6D|nr:hypothetical protein [Wielerella bovis]ULJ64579.1 hypothetical protein MIS33_10690 [Wielerella bovis]ULJ66868.1 hypothetical protein MIS31_11665 [Wielerella bovis]